MGHDAKSDLPYLELGQWVVSHPPKSYHRDESPHVLSPVLAVADMVAHTVEVLEPVGWLLLGLEVVLGKSELEERAELPAKRLEAQREEFRQLMWDKFWTNESFYDSRGVREAAFDKFVGDNANHAVVPELTKEAEVKRQQLMDQVSDRWIPKVEQLYDLQQRLATLEANKPPLSKANEEILRKGEPASFGSTDPNVLERNTYRAWEADTRDARKAFDSYQAAVAPEIANDVKSVKDFESNPANWNLTPDQQAILTSRSQP